MAIKRILIGIASFFISFFCIAFVFGLVSEIVPMPDSASSVASFCAIPISIAISVYVVRRFLPKTAEETEKKKLKLENKNAYSLSKSKANKIDVTQVPLFMFDGRAKLKLVGGLGNLPQGSVCKTRYNTNRIIFTANGQEFTLETTKLIDVSVMTQTDIQKQYVSSAGGAIAGALLLGPLGAIIGGSPSKKSIKSKQKYLVFSYRSNDETNYIVFDITKDTAAGNRIKATYNFLKKNEKVKVEL